VYFNIVAGENQFLDDLGDSIKVKLKSKAGSSHIEILENSGLLQYTGEPCLSDGDGISGNSSGISFSSRNASSD